VTAAPVRLPVPRPSIRANSNSWWRKPSKCDRRSRCRTSHRTIFEQVTGFVAAVSDLCLEGCGLGAKCGNRGRRTRLQWRPRRLRHRFGSGFFVAGVADPGAARSVKGYRIRRSRRALHRTSHRTIFEEGTGYVEAVSYSPTRTSALPAKRGNRGHRTRLQHSPAG
jgi:hypothetical protein